MPSWAELMPASAWIAAPPQRSLWEATAIPLRDLTSLAGEASADVVIVGAGYTGLSAAYHLAASGLEPIVIEANTPGWGASGRNGGVVTAKFRVTFPDIAAQHGKDVAARMYQLGNEAVDCVGEMVDRFAISAAGYKRVGQVKAAHNDKALRHASKEAEWLKAELGDSSIRLLDARQVRQETGSAGFVGGVQSDAAGGIHPLNFLRGIANGVADRGIRIHASTPALRIRRETNGVVVETPNGLVRARQVVIATNGYSDITGATAPFQKSLIPFRSAIIVTEKLSSNLAATIMPTRRSYSETRRMMRWFRMVEDRAIYGGRGAFGRRDSAGAFRSLHKAMVGTFPALADVPLAYQWFGLVAMTMDAVPHVGRYDERLLFALGYNGAGVAMSTLMGRYVAAFARGEAPDVGLLDAARLKTVPFYPIRVPAVRLVAGWYQFLDAIGR
jgi:gamma-glutamylputrescine oxidase